MTEKPLPLSGIRVVDLSRALAGPFCTMMLADLGADVIKVENPDGGDESRGWGPPYAASESAYYLSANRNKRGIAINIRTAPGADLVRRLALKSDIVVENFGPGVAERHRLDSPALCALNPRLICCSVSSFRPGSRYGDVPGYDFVIQAMSGLMSITGAPEGEPQKVGVAVVDVLTGLFACTGILAALQEREKTGKGQAVEVSLLDAALASLVNVAQAHLVTGEPPARWGNAHANLVPYQTFRASDGIIAVGVGNDQQFGRLGEVLGIVGLVEDPRFGTNMERVRHREELLLILSQRFQAAPVSVWLRQLGAARIPAAPVNSVDAILQDPYVREVGLVVPTPHPDAGEVSLLASPLLLEGIRPPVTRHPPLLGEHTDEVLEELLGLGPGDLAPMRRDGVIGGGSPRRL